MLSYHHPNVSAGLLPTPTSPIIKSDNPEDYIKSSNYPIPYQAMIAVEGANTHELLTWDINVTTQNVKVKIEWSVLDGSTSVKSDSIPKTVINSISLYNLTQPSWSTSYSTKRFSFKCDWKLVSTKPTLNNSFSPSTPSNFKSPNDSGYISNTSKSLNTSTPYTPSHNRSHRHDVYKPPFKQPVFYRDSPTKDIPSPKPTLPSTHQSSFTYISPPSSPHPSRQDTYTPSKPVGENSPSTLASKPSDTPKHDVKSKSIPPSLPSTSSSYSTSDPNLPLTFPKDHNPSKPPTLPDPTLPSTLPTITSPNDHIPPKSPTLPDSTLPSSHIPPKSPTLPDSTLLSTPSTLTSSDHHVPSKSSPITDADLSKINSSEKPKYTVSAKSTDRDIILVRDPQVDPMNCKYVPKPKNLPRSGKKKIFLDQKLDASRMDIVGNCRLCGESVSSCYTDYHIITCKSCDEMIAIEFYEKMAKLIAHGDEYNIESIVLNYCLYQLHIAEFDVNEFFDLKSFKTFIIELEQFLDNRAACIFKKLGYTNPRRFNILKYS